MNSIQILYIGNEDWTTKYNIPDFVEWENYEDTGIFPPKQVDIVILGFVLSLICTIGMIVLFASGMYDRLVNMTM